MKKIIHKTNKIYINNKIKHGEFTITIQVEKYFTKEMMQMIQNVNPDNTMDFSSISFQDIYNKKMHIVTRVDNEIVAYHQLIDARHCLLKDVLSRIKISNDEKENYNVLLYNFSCVNPRYRNGNLFCFLNYIVAYKYAIENDFSFISQFVRVNSTLIKSISEKNGLKKIVPSSFRIKDCWDSYYSNIDVHLYLSDNLKKNPTLSTYTINNLLNLALFNDRNNFFNLLNKNLLFNQGKL
ncbi:expressed protein [Dictyostelium purpureum]|uniref:Expressed protein n=1 Tax=Dictyostelium purpureum TaxID=5786 RepID=F0ZMS8_DICPU|nr:uncharacterized protein DICPUDRAFT_92149 [Dictyostelium purpureum]EGC34755.1 expressed protein [Dictyostelium purpureum]|eukprot:XP_003288717.1 expressed protein [Dictyostelium purpureum]